MASLTATDTSQGRSCAGPRTLESFFQAIDPGRFHRLVRDGLVARYGEADPAHVLVVRGDDAAEGDLVTGSRRCE